MKDDTMATANTSTKRKRIEQVAPLRVSRNPFLDAESHRLGLADNEALENVLSFLEQTKHTKLQRDLDGKLVPVSIASNVDRIVSDFSIHLSDSPLLSKHDTSSLIIPWAAKCLLFLSIGEDALESDLIILWKSLALSIDVFLSAKESVSRDLNQALSAQVVNKLIPFAVKSTFATDDHSISIHSARAFTLLTENFFRPTFEACCGMLVDLAAQVEVSAAMYQDHFLLSNRDLNSIVLASLRLLRSLQRLGVSSPKKIFQSLTKHTVLLAISKLSSVLAVDQFTNAHQLVIDILREAFFSPAHHIEGFRALQIDLSDAFWILEEKGGRQVFRCYQGDLLDTLMSLLGNASDESDTLALSQLIASLVEGFLAQTLVWKRDFLSQTTPKDISSISTMIFRVWGVLAGTILLKLESRSGNENASLMASLTSCLKVLLDHNGYHPTYEDTDQRHFHFLKSMSTRILALLTPRTSNSGLEGLVYMVQLNHLLFHEDLPKIIALAASTSRSEGTGSFHLFVCTLFKTYQHLRQLDYLVEALVTSTEWLEDSSAYAQIREAFDDVNVTKAIAVSVSAAPHGQV